MLRYYITDRRAIGGIEPLLRCIASAEADYIQIREKDLSARALFDLTRRAVAVSKVPILVNGRADIAMAVGAAELHLPARSMAPRDLRPLARLISVSCHTIDEVRSAAEEGADFAVF